MAREYFETRKERQMKLKKINAVLGLLIVLSLFAPPPHLPVVMLLIAVMKVCAISFTYGDLSYTISDGEVSIIDCFTSVTSVTIPLTIDGYPVQALAIMHSKIAQTSLPSQFPTA